MFKLLQVLVEVPEHGTKNVVNFNNGICAGNWSLMSCDCRANRACSAKLKANGFHGDRNIPIHAFWCKYGMAAAWFFSTRYADSSRPDISQVGVGVGVTVWVLEWYVCVWKSVAFSSTSLSYCPYLAYMCCFTHIVFMNEWLCVFFHAYCFHESMILFPLWLFDNVFPGPAHNSCEGWSTGTSHDAQTEGTYPCLNASIFNPVDIDTEKWMAASASLGVKEICLTAKHAGGFTLWPTKHSPYGVHAAYHWENGQGDVLKRFVASAKKWGIKVRQK